MDWYHTKLVQPTLLHKPGGVCRKPCKLGLKLNQRKLSILSHEKFRPNVYIHHESKILTIFSKESNGGNIWGKVCYRKPQEVFRKLSFFGCLGRIPFKMERLLLQTPVPGFVAFFSLSEPTLVDLMFPLHLSKDVKTELQNPQSYRLV